MISHESKETLKNPKKVHVAINREEHCVAIGEEISPDGAQYELKTSGKKGVIYSYPLVKKITEMLDLKFDGKTSITFYNVDYIDVNGNKIAIFYQ